MGSKLSTPGEHQAFLELLSAVQKFTKTLQEKRTDFFRKHECNSLLLDCEICTNHYAAFIDILVQNSFIQQFSVEKLLDIFRWAFPVFLFHYAYFVIIITVFTINVSWIANKAVIYKIFTYVSRIIQLIPYSFIKRKLDVRSFYSS